MTKKRAFISWSGEASGIVARALTKLLTDTFDNLDPFLSKDIPLGAEWFQEIRRSLQDSTFAIMCVTPDNLTSPWLHFEAGAVSMAVAEGETGTKRVVPYALDVTNSDLKPPLSQYQATTATEPETSKLLSEINVLLDADGITHDKLTSRFATHWPVMAERLDEARSKVNLATTVQPRLIDDKVDELLDVVRRIDRSLPIDVVGILERELTRGSLPPHMSAAGQLADFSTAAATFGNVSVGGRVARVTFPGYHIDQFLNLLHQRHPNRRWTEGEPVGLGQPLSILYDGELLPADEVVHLIMLAQDQYGLKVALVNDD